MLQVDLLIVLQVGRGQGKEWELDGEEEAVMVNGRREGKVVRKENEV